MGGPARQTKSRWWAVCCLSGVLGWTLAACTAPGVAPVVSRTAPKSVAPTPALRPPVSEPLVVQTTPVRASDTRGIEVRPLDTAAPVGSPGSVSGSSAAPSGPGHGPVTLRTMPRGLKVPYSDALWNEMKAADQAALTTKVKPEVRGATATEPEVKAKVAAKPDESAVVHTESKPTEEVKPKAEPPREAKSEVKPETKPESKSEGEPGTRDWAWPLPGTVLQAFDGVAQKGLLIAGKAGDPVGAAADGQVIFSGNGPRGYGNLVIVKHPKDLVSVYAQNRSLSVKEGQQVKRGQKLAEMGEPRLHFEIRQRGKPVDPTRFLPSR